jgi:hypothetical protein
MYLTGLTAEQVSPPSYEHHCQAKVRWSYGNQEADVIQFWWKGGSDSDWSPLGPPVSIDADNPVVETELTVPAGVPGWIFACPRLLEDGGGFEERQPDDDGEEKHWTGFCGYTQFISQRLEDPPPDRCGKAPVITKMELGYGSVTVRWSNPEGYDRFIVEFADPTTGGQPRSYKTENTEYRFEKLPEGGCWARVTGIHDGKLTGTDTCTSPPSGVEEIAVPRDLAYYEAKFAPGTPLATLKKYSDHTEVFGCLPDGRPVGIWQDAPPWWHPWYSHDAGPGFPGGASLTALSRDDDFMDLFCIANDQRLYFAWWNGEPWREWFQMSDREFQPGAPIAALSRNSDQMDLFVVDTRGTVRSTWWNGAPWRDWFALPGPSFPSGAPIAAICRHKDQMDIFAIDVSGVVRNCWWNGEPWRDWNELGGFTFPGGASIAATTRNTDHMEVAAVDVNGNALANHWQGEWSGWMVIAGATFPPGAKLAAAHDLYAVASDGYVRSGILRKKNPSWYRVQ